MLTPLYKAGEIPNVLRFSVRDENLGGDSWGTRSANDLLASLSQFLIFNDLSLEHGPRFELHSSHRVGTSIDVRYLGPGGEGNGLNRVAATRKARWDQAQGGDVAARREMVAWVRANRTNMDAVFATGSVRLIYIGNAAWNWRPIVEGTFGDGTAVIDPDTGLALGAWQTTGTPTPYPGHLDHLHIEMKPSILGNPR